MNLLKLLLLNVFIVVIRLDFSSCSLVKWIPDTSFNLPINFEDGKLPCGNTTIIFPEPLISSVSVDSEINVKELVLPFNGDLVFKEGGVIEFGTSGVQQTSCVPKDVDYKELLVSWAHANVWSSKKYSKATPDTGRIPCFDDTVEFPSKTQFSIELPNQIQTVEDVIIDGQSVSDEQFKAIAIMNDNPFQIFILNSYYETGVQIRDKKCFNITGCPCQEKWPVINCISKYCPTPDCISPIRPRGNCCYLCGTEFVFELEAEFNMMSFKYIVQRSINEYGAEYFDYYVGRLPDDVVQLIIMEHKPYTGKAEAVIQSVREKINPSWIKNIEKLTSSGSSLSGNTMGVVIAIYVLFGVVLVMGAVYVYYYRLPKCAVRKVRVGRKTGMLSRFHKRTESIVSLTRRDSSTSVAPSNSFQNPLYSSQSGLADITESEPTEEKYD